MNRKSHLKASDLRGARRDYAEEVVTDENGNPARNKDGSYPQHFKEVDESLQGLENDYLTLNKYLRKEGLDQTTIDYIKGQMNEIVKELGQAVCYLVKGYFTNDPNELKYFIDDFVMPALKLDAPSGGGDTPTGGYIPRSRILTLMRWYLKDGWLARMEAKAAQGETGPPDMNNGGCLTSKNCR